ncbi:[NiFe] hydrogenase metallocenter assembly protein HypF [Imhoffiella purpurea]|uniref:Carbamoyltransferase HypF n=1 Tax=Imhoffiella purpurea TaxID=1249627 RepID=W9V3G6_9GAMM|nr:[NiFe] hydrogenase metallocenter assembly protein HypF [Imhoffiella purpurea]
MWRLAQECHLVGDVCNDGEGVLIRARPASDSDPNAIDRFCERLSAECPPLARIDAIERRPLTEPAPSGGFRIRDSELTQARTGIVADAATCPDCAREIRDPADRRHRYPFTNCTHCGPRLTIVRGIPYDRSRTSMSVFPMCPACRAEYGDPADRRFHAQPNACPDCGPRLWLVDADGLELDTRETGDLDAISAASRLLREGRILAIKGIGGFHLACDATNAEAVAELRRRKRRYAKPFALMARDLDVIARYCAIDPEAARILTAPAAPILLLDRHDPDSANGPALAADIAPGQTSLGFMLPYSPLHHLLLDDWDRPLVMTSGNLSEEPQCIDNRDAVARLGPLADFGLLHDRDILNRVDDSVVRVMAGAPRLIRRARGYAPSPIVLPPGFDSAPAVLALGGELKSSFCLLRRGEAIPSQHLGDLEDARTAREYERTLDLYLDLFQHRPRILAVDRHPDYRSTLIGRDRASRWEIPMVDIQHHHAHLASTLADNGWPLKGSPVLGIILDGLGYGDDDTIWGGEFLVGDYRDCRRVGHLEPVAMPGGTQAILEPWRNLFAQLEKAGGLEAMRRRHQGLSALDRLAARPLDVLRTMIERGINAPRSSAAGRLFDAVAAALGICGDRILYEGQAAIELESLAAGYPTDSEPGYPFRATKSPSGIRLNAAPMWPALFRDLAAGLETGRISSRFHRGFATAIVKLALEIAGDLQIGTMALSGGVFQNRILMESVSKDLSDAGIRVLMQRQVPSNDGGLSLGQACIAAARALQNLDR